jgi:hypothetical protein
MVRPERGDLFAPPAQPPYSGQPVQPAQALDGGQSPHPGKGAAIGREEGEQGLPVPASLNQGDHLRRRQASVAYGASLEKRDAGHDRIMTTMTAQHGVFQLAGPPITDRRGEGAPAEGATKPT